MKTEKFNITGMTCAACQANVTKRVQKLPGVEDVNVSLMANSMTVSYDEQALDTGRITGAVMEIGYGAAPVDVPAGGKANDFKSQWEERQQRAKDEQGRMRRRLITSIAILVPLMYIAMGGMMGLPLPGILTGMENALISALTQMLMTIPILLINRHFYDNGLKALVKRAPNMDSLVAIGSGASFVYGVFAIYSMAFGLGHGDLMLVHQYAHELYFESAAMIVTLVTVGKYLEARSKAKTSDALSKLVDLAPKTAVVVHDGEEVTIPAEQVVAGDILVIRPGESIPVDGVVLSGYGYVDQAAITGESIPVEKKPGDTVLSATINQNGSFRFQANRVGEDTTLAQIIRLVDEAGNSKAPIARLADKVSAVFVPVVIGIAFVTANIWLVAGEEFTFALSNAIAVLVISCPCALGLATPVAIMVGTGKAAELGILIKSAQSLELLHTVDTVVLDKTGTITEGHPAVTDVLVVQDGLEQAEFLKLAATLEAGSEHPLAQAVVERAKADGLAVEEAEAFEARPGQGVWARIDGREYIGGNLLYLKENGLLEEQLAKTQAERLAQEGKTPLLFAEGGRLLGIIAVADTIREDSRAAISRFHEMGLSVVMLTGDNRVTAEAIRRELNIGQAIADVLPTGKEAKIRELQAQGHRVAMVGDGINDAPALMRADVGIAIGAGTDIAIDSADVVLMKDSLLDVATAIDLSRAVVRNIRMNLFWAFFYNILGIPIAAGALFPAFHIRLSPMLGSAAMSLSSVCVVTNALRLRFFKPKEKAATQKQVNSGEPTLPVEKGRNSMNKTVQVEGMMCNHCKAHVEKALAGVQGVSKAEVDLEKKQAVVELTGDVADAALIAAVTEAGYEVVSVQ